MRYRLQRHDGTDCSATMVPITVLRMVPIQRYRHITEGELRLCAYIRTGMENKHIAQMLSLQPESVKKNRYRLRQKLNLGKESLEDFLRGI